MLEEKRMTVERLFTLIEMYSAADAGDPVSHMGMPTMFRFYSKVKIDDSGCWHWTGVRDRDGYSAFKPMNKKVRAHRFIHEYFNGTIGAGLEIHHICRNRACVNPLHLITVTHAQNMMFTRKPMCNRGHSKSGRNLYVQPSTGKRKCRECSRKSQRKRSVAN